MSKLTKMVGLDKDSTDMIAPDDTVAPADQNPEAGQYDRSHKQKAEKIQDDAKKAEREAELKRRGGGVKVKPKHSMQLKSGKSLLAGEETEISEDDMEALKAGHPLTHEDLWHK